MMILDGSGKTKVLYLDHDEEEFELYGRHFTDEAFMDQWRKSLLRLHRVGSPVLLPTYFEQHDSMTDLQGYVVYPYESAWILIDSGVRMPRHVDISSSYEYINSFDEELPSDRKEWQSHWWITSDDLDLLAHDLGMELVFTKGAIPTWPLECYRKNEHLDIYAGKTHFAIDFSTFDNQEDVRRYAKEKLEKYLNKSESVITIPALIDDDAMILYSFFDESVYSYIAQSVLSCDDKVVDFDRIESWVEAHDARPYIHKRNPLVYSWHARYSPGTIARLFDTL